MPKLMKISGNSKSTVATELKVAVLAGVAKGGLSAKESMRVNGEEFNHEFKPSYFKYPHTHISRWTKEINKKVDAGNEEIITICRQYDLIED